jgi:microcin C transport system permease protein
MTPYIFRRLLLIIPTLFGIMVINFALTQFVPGGPIEQIIANFEGNGDVFEGIAGGGKEVAQKFEQNDRYTGARGLPPEFIAELEKEFGFDKPPLSRFFFHDVELPSA